MAEDIIMITEDNTSLIDKAIVRFKDISIKNFKEKFPPRLRFLLCCNENMIVREYIIKNINYLKYEDFIIGENKLPLVFLEKYFEYYLVGPNIYLFTSDVEKYKNEKDNIEKIFKIILN